MNKTKVLVFTNSDKKDSLSEKVLDTVLTDVWEKAYPCEFNPIVKCVFSNSGTDLLSVDINNLAKEEGVFLIYDGVEPKKPFLDDLKKQCNGDNLYVLVHTHGPDLNDFQDWTLSGLLPGSHTGLPQDHYSPLFDILTDTEPNTNKKMERIINKVFTPNLEIVLKFLHQCLFPNPDNKSVVSELKSTLLERLPGNSEAKRALRNYTTSTGTGLENLRDKLLDFALNNQ